MESKIFTIYNNYKNGEADYDGNSYAIDILKDNRFGPLTYEGSTLQQIQTEKDTIVGNTLKTLKSVKETSLLVPGYK